MEKYLQKMHHAKTNDSAILDFKKFEIITVGTIQGK